MLKELSYKILDMLTFGKGINCRFEGNRIRIPTRYYRYFPKEYEQENFRFINEHVCKGMTIFDIGAHIGLMTVPLARRAGCEGNVFAFEPTPTTAAVLKRTIQLNKLANVSVEPCAISDKKGTSTFFISEFEVDNSNSLVDNKRIDREESSIEVNVSTIDELVKEKNLQCIDFIKIDAEGVEARVLKGGTEAIRKFKPLMILSIHPFALKNFGESQVAIWDWIKEQGYKIINHGKEMGRKEFSEETDLFDVLLT